MKVTTKILLTRLGIMTLVYHTAIVIGQGIACFVTMSNVIDLNITEWDSSIRGLYLLAYLMSLFITYIIFDERNKDNDLKEPEMTSKDVKGIIERFK